MSASPGITKTDEAIQPDVEENETEEQEVDEDQEEEIEAEEEEADEDEDEENLPDEDQPAAEETRPAEERTIGEEQPEGEEAVPEKKKRKKKAPGTQEREPGKSLFPFSRVQKIIKADREIPLVTKDAVFLIALATEAFIEGLAAAAQRVAEKERRTTVRHQDIATVVRKADEFMFLEDIVPWLTWESETKRTKARSDANGDKPDKSSKSTKDEKAVKHSGPTLDKFVISNKEPSRTEDEMDIVMNDDGTMTAVGDTQLDDD
ncbi:Putative transcription factor C16C4.22 [Leucoagaricus sp. SymC.cos]|nr:Putative transcription factor C16C4.22 [Leucoagaricus sp. SymC.cos]